MLLRLSAIHANKERCPTMHFPSVVHLAPRRNDLFDVYSRSLTLIKITANPRFASLFFFLFFSLSLSFSFFWGSFLISPPSFVLPFVVPKDSPQGMETVHHQDFRFLPYVARWCSAERDPYSYFARGSSCVYRVFEIMMRIVILYV